MTTDYIDLMFNPFLSPANNRDVILFVRVKYKIKRALQLHNWLIQRLYLFPDLA